MGIIERQSIKGSLVSYFGVFLGFFATLYIYPLEWELYGSIQFWLSGATVLAPILKMGSTSLINKFFPYFRSNNIKGFLGFILAITTLSVIGISLILFTLFYLLSESSFFQSDSLQSDNIIYVYVLSIIMVYYSVFQLQSANIRRIVIPEILSKLGLKIVTVSIIFLAYINVIGKEWSLPIIIIFYSTALLLLIVYLKYIGGIDIAGVRQIKVSKSVKKNMIYFWAFGGLNFIGTLLAYKIDILMIGTFMNKISVGYYSIFLFISNLMFIPMNSINQISGPIISESFEKEEIDNIETIYKKSSNNLLAFGSIVFILIWLNIYFVLDIMRQGEDLVPFVSIILFLGSAKIFDLITSVNNLIMIYSKWYNYNLIFLFATSALNFYMNYILIESYGIQGVAIATSISILLFNSIKTIFIYVKLGIHPFSRNTFIILLVLVFGLLITGYLQQITIVNSYISLLVYSVLCSVIVIPLMYILKVSPELNKVLSKFLKFKKL